MRFKVQSTWRGKVRESDPLTLAQAHNLAQEWKRAGKCKTLILLRDDEGADHPANAGKFFLHQIWKR